MPITYDFDVVVIIQKKIFNFQVPAERKTEFRMKNLLVLCIQNFTQDT